MTDDEAHYERKAFLGAVATHDTYWWAQETELGEALVTIRNQTAATWPQFTIEDSAFSKYIGSRVAEKCGVKKILNLHLSDLFLACACSSGCDAAIVAFEEYCSGEVERGVAQLGLSRVSIDEIKQTLRTRLFVSNTPGHEHIRKYSGKGSIRAWYRITALHESIDYLRGKRRISSNREATTLEEQTPFIDPELNYLKKMYRDQFKESFQMALSELTCQQRNLLRYQLLDGLTLAEIGTIYGLHLSSVGRALEKVRQILLERTGHHLRTLLDIDEMELESIMRMIQSHLDVSISGLLRSD